MSASTISLNPLFKALSITEPALQKKIKEVGVIATLDKNEWVIKKNHYIHWLIFVLKGNVRVWQEGDLKEISLYNVGPFETCAFSLAATFKDYKSLVFAKTTLPTEVLKIPVRYVSPWFNQYKSWNRLAFSIFIDSYENLLHEYSNLAFNKVAERLMTYLQNKVASQNSSLLELTHQTLANEIGTSREVISRTLKQLEEIGVIERSFKKIRVVT